MPRGRDRPRRVRAAGPVESRKTEEGSGGGKGRKQMKFDPMRIHERDSTVNKMMDDLADAAPSVIKGLGVVLLAVVAVSVAFFVSLVVACIGAHKRGDH